MSEKPTVVVPVVRPSIIALSSNPRRDATIECETTADADVVLAMTALIELEATLAKASQEQAKHQPVQ